MKIKEGKVAPDFTIMELSGNPFSLSEDHLPVASNKSFLNLTYNN